MFRNQLNGYRKIITGLSIKKVSGLVILLLLLLGVGYATPTFVHATSGPTIQFGPTVLSGSATNAKEPAVSTSSNGQYVYVAWTQGSQGIYFTVSSNGGSTWSSPLKISTTRGSAQFPVMITGDGYESVNQGDVYVSWAQTVSQALQIFVASSTDNGVPGSWTVKQVSTAGGITPALAAAGSDVYVTWNQNSACPVTSLNPLNETTGLGESACVYVDSSTNNGTTWSAPVELNPSTGGEAQVVASGNYAYVVADLQYFSSYNVTNSTWDANTTSPTGWSTPIQYYYYYTYDPSSPSTSCPLSLTLPPGCLLSYGREPWVAASGLDVYLTWEAVNLSSTTGLYSDYGITSTDGGLNWYPGTCNSVTCPGSELTDLPPTINNASQQVPFSVSKQAPDTWEPENVALNSTAFLTFHSLQGQGVFVTSTTNNGSSWSKPVQVNAGMKGTSAFGHIFTSDGTNVWVMWGQVKSPSVWNAYVSYSGNSGGNWSAPLDISNNAAGVAAGNQDVTLFWVSSIGATCFAVYTYTSGGTSQVWFTSITG
jgi:hypothetical protein